MLICDPLILIMGVTFADEAFINEFKDPKLRSPLAEVEKGVQKRPVLRDVEDSEDGIRIALDKALTCGKERDHLIRLGWPIGMAKILEWYDLRLRSGKKLNGELFPGSTPKHLRPQSHTAALTPEKRNKIMGHQQVISRVYVRYNMSLFNDVNYPTVYFSSAQQCSAAQPDPSRRTAPLTRRRPNGTHAPT
jgi:hypothetical protein